jgi:integrase
LRICLTDTGMPLDLRVAGALLLVYGLTLSRIAYLTRDDIVHRDGQTWLRHYGHQLLMPPRLATLIRQLAGQPAPGTILIRLAGPPRWLFPGSDPTRPASHDHLRTGLTRHTITPHAGRNTAIGSLAAELPAPVLAGITGLHITTATSWTRSTSRDWTHYLAARTQGP